MRYRLTTPRSQTRVPAKDRWRLWMMVVALGLVMAVMRQLDKPETIEGLDRLFGETQSQPSEPLSESVVAEVVSERELAEQSPAVGDLHDTQESPRAAASEGVDLSVIRDNTFLRSEERPAWFLLLSQLQEQSEQQLAEQSVGLMTYAQLLQQPEVYRGKIVSLEGTVVRQELQRPGDNELGIEEYHRLWVRPQGGGQWPFVVFCLSLPADFPRGDKIRASVRIEGYFFKNWSYSWDDGLGLAPLVLANQPQWHQPVATTQVRSRDSWQAWGGAIAIATVVALGITWMALRRTRRRPSRPEPSASIQHQLADLVEGNET